MSCFGQLLAGTRRYPKCPARERGAGLILFFLLIGIGILALFAGVTNTNSTKFGRDRATDQALARARTALLAWSVSQGGLTGNPRPGEFPCPDTNNDGQAEPTCIAGRLGRLPWKTLGIEQPIDGSGESLWYVVSGPYRTFANNSNPINSDTRGNITVYAANGIDKISGEAVAVILSPGPPVAGQSRSTLTSTACATTGTTVTQDRCATNFLETANGINNAATHGPFIAGNPLSSFNDRLVTLTTKDIIPLVEQRVGREVKAALAAYYAANSYYPFAAKYDDTTGNCAMNNRRGRLPLSIRVDPSLPPPPNTPCGLTKPATGSGLVEWTGTLPNWLLVNRWDRVIYYSVAAGYSFGGPNSCSGGCLNIGASSSVAALIFTPGTPLPSATGRGNPVNNSTNVLSDYLEDSANQDGWTPSADNNYAMPTSTAFDRDRLLTLP